MNYCYLQQYRSIPKHDIKRKEKPDGNEYILQESTYIKFKIRQSWFMGLEVGGYSRRKAWLNSGWGMVCVCACVRMYVCVCVMLYFLILIADSWVHSFRFYSWFCVYMIFYLDVYSRGNEGLGCVLPSRLNHIKELGSALTVDPLCSLHRMPSPKFNFRTSWWTSNHVPRQRLLQYCPGATE